VKKMVGITVASVAVLVVLRRFGPGLRDRAMTKCQEMFESQRALDKERDELLSAKAG
jgi:hypothetical protein